MGKFFSRVKKDPVDPGVSSAGNMANFYSLLIFLIAIPFVLIIALVWVTGILGFNAYIFAGFAGLLAYIVWRLYRRWGIIKAKMAAQTGDFQDLMREATQSGKDVEISLMNGIFTLRYAGAHSLTQASLPAGRPQPLALAGPLTLESEAAETRAWLPPERLREELEEFIKLRDEGVISPEEFDRIKASLLQRMSA
ncbi:MAG: SHOCT domain-containing protein [Proteobacteria bacterium]|nr:SHOCT domain-containing protein [Pseudomonadota bacterium]MBU4356113.1 SHOCT domain-containing protein [Pseudomonadota bacterium]MBU4449021.1 SHOCT domain-containing protein [Pseudomonadota bacterium]MCG2771548.1 SHOCT domain-containing protein [Desulfobacterales bacterium]